MQTTIKPVLSTYVNNNGTLFCLVYKNRTVEKSLPIDLFYLTNVISYCVFKFVAFTKIFFMIHLVKLLIHESDVEFISTQNFFNFVK